MNSSKNYSLILFDLDGTLMNTSIGIINSVDYTIDKLKLTPLADEVKKTFIGPPIYNSLKKTYNMTDDEAQNATEIFRDVYKNKFLFDAVIYDGITELLQTLQKDYKLAVASYKRDDYCKMLLEHFGLSKYFHFIMGADAENKLKKSDIVQACMDNFNITSPKEAVLIGDTEHDALGAEALNMDFIGVTYGFGFKNLDDMNKYKNIGMAQDAKDILKFL